MALVCLVLYAGALVLAVLAIDEEPWGSAALALCGGSLCSAGVARLTHRQPSTLRRAPEVLLTAVVSGAVIGVAGAARDGVPLAVAAVALGGGVTVASVLDELRQSPGPS